MRRHVLPTHVPNSFEQFTRDIPLIVNYLSVSRKNELQADTMIGYRRRILSFDTWFAYTGASITALMDEALAEFCDVLYYEKPLRGRSKTVRMCVFSL